MSNFMGFCTLDPAESLDDREPPKALIDDARAGAIEDSAHHVREFNLLRHPLLRFLVRRCGFSVYALGAPFTKALVVDAWVQGGPDQVLDLAGRDVERAHAPELPDALAWFREHNATVDRSVRFAVPSGGAPSAGPRRSWAI